MLDWAYVLVIMNLVGKRDERVARKDLCPLLVGHTNALPAQHNNQLHMGVHMRGGRKASAVHEIIQRLFFFNIEIQKHPSAKIAIFV